MLEIHSVIWSLITSPLSIHVSPALVLHTRLSRTQVLQLIFLFFNDLSCNSYISLSPSLCSITVIFSVSIVILWKFLTLDIKIDPSFKDFFPIYIIEHDDKINILGKLYKMNDSDHHFGLYKWDELLILNGFKPVREKRKVKSPLKPLRTVLERCYKRCRCVLSRDIQCSHVVSPKLFLLCISMTSMFNKLGSHIY